MENTEHMFSPNPSRPFDGSQTQKFSTSYGSKFTGFSTYDSARFQKQLKEFNERNQAKIEHESSPAITFSDVIDRTEFTGAKNRYNLGLHTDTEMFADKTDFNKCKLLSVNLLVGQEARPAGKSSTSIKDRFNIFHG
jgi:hypothetical protein